MKLLRLLLSYSSKISTFFENKFFQILKFKGFKDINYIVLVAIALPSRNKNISLLVLSHLK